MRQYDESATATTSQRLAGTLTRLAKEAAGRFAGPELEVRMSRQELAELTGTTMYTVSRWISRWALDGIVQSGRGRVTIRDLERLRRLSRSGAD